MCFIDLAEAYDEVHLTLLWVMLARFEKPAKMIAVIRQSRDELRGRLRTTCWEVMEQVRNQVGSKSDGAPTIVRAIIIPQPFDIFVATILSTAKKTLLYDMRITGRNRGGGKEDERGTRG